MMKRIISFLLALVICLTCLPDVRLHARANDDEIPAATEAPETPTAVPTETSAPQVVFADWTPPYKNEYIVNREKLDTTGCTLTLTYDDGTQEVFNITPDMVTGFDNTVPGSQTLIAGCQGYQLYFDVVIIDEPKPQHIYFNGWQIKNAYPQGAPLDLTDGVVEVFYDNGSQESVPATDPSVTVSGYDPNLLGTQILTVSYMGLTAEFEVTVYTLSGQCGDDLQYSFDEATGTLTITGSGAMYEFGWDSVPWGAFKDQIMKVELPSGLTTLGSCAFSGCSDLHELNLPQGLERIGDHALEECHNLTSLTIPSSVKYIGVYAVCGVGLMELVLPEGLETIDMYAFMGCHSLSKVVLPKSLKTLGGGAFQYCENLETAELPETLDMISWQVFNECNSLQDILIPKSVTEISYFAFNSCTAMQDVVFEGSAPTVDAGMTGDMYPFKNVTSEAWYPAGDATWTPAAMAAMGGNLTWMNGESMPSGTCGGDLTWYLDASHTLHISGTGEMEGYSHYSAPWNGNTVYRVVVHPGVTTIGSDAFYDMKEIAEVQLPDTLIEIGSDSFFYCSALTEITIPSSVVEIRYGAFAGCTGLESIVIPGTVNVGDEAFANCTGLTEVILGDGFTHLSNEVFSNCASLKTVILPEGLKTIGTGTFTACPALTEITIPSTVTEIHSSAFGRNRLEKSVTIDPEKTITFTGDAPEMENGAFSGSVIIARYPFGNLTWTADKMQDYGGTVTWVPTGSVAGTCGKNLSWTLEDGVLTVSGTGEMFGFPEDNPAPWSAYHTFIEKVVVESGVTTIGSHAFDGTACPGYAGITELELPDTLVSIGEGAFNTCLGLTSICIPGSVTKIGGGAFASCENLETVVLSEGLQIIGDAAFDFCSALKEITVPSTVTIVGEYAFSGETGAEKTIHFTGNAPKFNENAFYEIVASVYYPADDATWTAEKMQNYGGTVTWIPDSGCVLSGTCGDSLTWVFDEETGTLTIAGSGAMYNYTWDGAPWKPYAEQILAVELPDTLTALGAYAFDGCVNLRQIQLPEGIPAIPAYAFNKCMSLTSLTIPDSVKVIGDTALSECNSLTSLVLPDGVETVENFAFSWNSGLKEIVLPETLQNLNCGVFDNCTALESVNIPESLETINWATFQGCTSLKEITIPKSITEIAYHAFIDCTGLETVIFEGSAPSNIAGMNDPFWAPFKFVTADAWYPADDATWTAEAMDLMGEDLRWIPNAPLENCIIVDAAELGNTDAVCIDGKDYAVCYKGGSGYIYLPDSNAKTMVAYTYHEGNPDDVHTRYPVSMKVWTLTNEDGYYTVHRQQQLDDLLQYSGMSIRVYGKKGIRMITSIEQAKKNALTGAGLAGFTLKEYGTVLAWADQISDNKPVVLGKYYAKSNYAYRKGIADPVFNVTGSLMQYTNVLVNFSDAQCRDDIAMRPYIILEDESGQQITLYGGIVQRSIGYIAYQNRNVFEPGTDEYEYVWSIIRYVYGTLYDDEYIVAWTPPAM